MSRKLTNWAANYEFSPAQIHRPRTAGEVQDLVVSAKKVKALGTRHSFNGIADTVGDLISMEHFDRSFSFHRERGVVTVGGGVRYGELGEWLDGQGYALHNLASLPHISVAGACATGTHGSGVLNGNLATAITEMEMVLADGSIVTFSRDSHPDEFNGLVVSLGALGIVTRLSLDVEPAYEVRQFVYEDLPVGQMEDRFDEIMSSAYSVSLFTKWGGPVVDQVWIKERASRDYGREPEFYGARPAPVNRHPIKSSPADNCTEQMGIPGPWHKRLPHFRLEYTPSNGEELQSEYFVPRANAMRAIQALWRLGDRINPVLHISEIRTIAADQLWMSPCYGKDSVGIHFTWRQEDAVFELLPEIEQVLAPFHARPHWAKLFSGSPSPLYDRLADFRGLLERYDPQGKFRNAFIEREIFG